MIEPEEFRGISGREIASAGPHWRYFEAIFKVPPSTKMSLPFEASPPVRLKAP